MLWGKEKSLGKALAPCAFHFASPFLVLTAKAELCEVHSFMGCFVGCRNQ